MAYLATLHDLIKELVWFALDRLVELQLITVADAEINIRQLLQGTNFYGGFFELATYGWMLRHALHFQPQIRFNPPDILSANPCMLDGILAFYDTAFDIKAFGLAPYLLQIFKQKLLAQGLRVTVDGPVDVDVKTVQTDALAQLKPIAAELRDKGVATINSLHWEVKPIKGRPPMVRSTTTSGPYKQAEELRYYPFGHAHQFTTQKPFMLVFPYLPRFNIFLTEDSSGLNEKFFRSLARRAFIQLSNDPRDCSECDSAVPSAVTVGYASTLLSGILFVDLCTGRYHVFSNPRAKNPIARGIISFTMNIQPPTALASYDDFANDDY